MPTIQLEAQLSTKELLGAVEQLDLSELEAFLHKAMLVRAQRIAPILSPTESELLQKVNEGVPEELLTRFDALSEQQTKRTLSVAEEAELYDLVNQIETAEAQRIPYLAQLAQLRGQTLTQLMSALAINPSSHVSCSCDNQTTSSSG
ncbi:MAG: hypothetical protein KDE56_25850 [Anaerolineales bacterium]|nr:hypothetical protein [Anaerolineales bacterium]